MKIHLDTQSGIAGDMFLGACLDLGLDQAALTQALTGLGVDGWSFDLSQERRGGIRGMRLEVIAPEEKKHRHLRHIIALIEQAHFPAPVAKRAKAIFHTLAVAEGAMHGVSPEKVHFHEVGAVDAIIDICGAAFALWHLGVTEVTATPLPLNSGQVTCAHGQMPLPAPAVTEILKSHQVPLQPVAFDRELVTPTGAAILVNMVDRFGPPDLTRIDRVGYGLGGREIAGQANALRILAQEATAPSPASATPSASTTPIPTLDRGWVGELTTHVDDMNPEWYGPLWETLFAAGALDVALIPMTMKKGRPGVRIEVMTPLGQEEKLARLLLTHTTALGVRFNRRERFTLPRSHRLFETPWGSLRAVEAGEIWRVEQDDLATLAKRQGWSLPQARQEIAPHLQTAIQQDAAAPTTESNSQATEG
ncbi:MAG: nickel pincer cofactor biosynthesis protein LarC [Magnetococcales bacterium]|nr:nickel pincer cofactor biosynthesis protein LarC [Magnetococcales bacterium]